MSSPMRSALTAGSAAVYVAATASALIWGVDLFIISAIEGALEALSLVSTTWQTNFDRWDMMIAAGLALPAAVYVGVDFYMRAYRIESGLTDV